MALRVATVMAHPDDESMGCGGLLAALADRGVETYVVCATDGQLGWQGDKATKPEPDALGELRRGELRAACEVMGVTGLECLGYMDGSLDRVPAREASARIATVLRQIRPDVVITFGPEGAYGHPDHIAISQFAHTACILAGTPSAADVSGEPHLVSKLYYMLSDHPGMDAFLEWWGNPRRKSDGSERHVFAYDDWVISTRIDISAYVDQMWRAIGCHLSQLPRQEPLAETPAEVLLPHLREATFYRAFSLVNQGREVETDILEGLL